MPLTFTETPSEVEFVELDWFDRPEELRVNPRDHNRFSIQIDRAIKILQLANDSEKQMNLLLSRLGVWIRKNETSIEAAFVTLRDGAIAFIAVSRQPRYDDALEDAISDLDLDIANDPELTSLRVNMMVLPPASLEALSSFLDTRFRLRYRGKGS